MKTFGRILLLIVGIILLVTGGLSLYSSIANINALGGWNDLLDNQAKITELIMLIDASLGLVAGVGAILGFIRGKSNFILTLFGFFILVGIIIYLISAALAGTIGTPETIVKLVLGFILPIAYLLGSFFVRFK